MANKLKIIFAIWLVGFLLNIIWEFNHCQLYTTCINWEDGYRDRYLTFMSFKDGFFITLFYVGTVWVFGNWQILGNKKQLLSFLFVALVFAFGNEAISTAIDRWHYAPTMPTIWNVGLSPLLEIALTGAVTFMLVFKLFNLKSHE